MSAPPDERAADRLFHFVDGSDVATEPLRFHQWSPHRPLSQPVVPIASEDDLPALLDQCAIGLARWLAIGPGQRQRILADVPVALRRSTFEIADAVADDVGIDCESAVGLVKHGIDRLAGAASRRASAQLPVGLLAVLVGHRPGGVMLPDPIWPLLLGGSTVVVRPAPEHARAASVVAVALSLAGLPDGVFNVIHGDGQTALALLRDPAVAGVLAVGSPTHLAFIARAASGSGKPTILAAFDAARS